MLSKKIGNIYEALQGDCINYEHFICGDPISRIWENLVKYIEIIKRGELDIKKPKRIEILIEPDIINFIRSNLEEHITSVRKIEMISEEPTLPYIPEADRLILKSLDSS